MRKFFTGIARVIAAFFSILFVITTVPALFLTTVGQQVFNADLYKNALADQQIYERLPEIVGTLLTSNVIINPCAENPLSCSIDGASPELQACLTAALGPDEYQAIGSGQRKPTDAELGLAQPCLDQYGAASTASANGFGYGLNPLPSASPELQACINQAIGEQAYLELYSGTRQPNSNEKQQMQPCFDQAKNENSSGGQGGMPPFLQNLKASDWEAIIKLILPPEELKSMTDNLIDQLFSYLTGETDSVSLSLVSLKQHLTGPDGVEAIKILLKAQPDCTPEQSILLTTNNSDAGKLAYCNPPAAVLEMPMPQLQQQLNTTIHQLPDSAIIIKPTPADKAPTDSGPFGNDPVSVIHTLRLVLRLSLLLPLVFLLLVTLFGVRTLKSWMRWWSIPIFFAGVVTLVLGIIAVPAADLAWNVYVTPRIPVFLPPEVADIGHSLATFIVHGLSEPLVLYALILAVAGLAAWIVSYFIKARTKPPVPGTPENPAA